MRLVIIGAVLMLLIAGGAIVLVNNQGGETPGEGAEETAHSLVVELVAPVTKETGQDVMPKMVSVKLTLRFANEDLLNKARGEIRRLRRAYTETIGTYLSNREKTADVEAEIRARVAKKSEELFGTGVVTAFEVEGQFGEQAAN